MFEMSVSDLVLTMASCLFVLGVLCIIAGFIILVTRVAGREMKVIAQQTAQLAQKGLSDEVAGLVGNASSLVEAMNQLVRTAAGVGVFLTLIGLVFIAAAYYLAMQL